LLKFYGITEFIGGVIEGIRSNAKPCFQGGDNAHSRINSALKFIAYKYGKSQKKLL
jgi:hypothetical protein